MTAPSLIAAALIALLPAVADAGSSTTRVTKAHHAHHQMLHDAPFDMQACLKGAEPLYASPAERQAVCNDMRSGV